MEMGTEIAASAQIHPLAIYKETRFNILFSIFVAF